MPISGQANLVDVAAAAGAVWVATADEVVRVDPALVGWATRNTSLQGPDPFQQPGMNSHIFC